MSPPARRDRDPIRSRDAPRWTALTVGAVACVLGAALLGDRAKLSVVAAGLGLGAVAAYGVAGVRAGLPCAALLVGAALLPGHLWRSARQP